MSRRYPAMLLTTVAALTAAAWAAPPPEMPPQYRALYRELEGELQSLERDVARLPGPPATATAVGVELLVANSNRGPMLLEPQTIDAVRLNLDRLVALGAECVSLSIQFPVLTRGFPRSASYRDFYRDVADEVRRRGLVLVVEMGTIFREPEFAGHDIDYRGMTLARFRDGIVEQTEIVARELRPDHLTILSEPDTAARNLGISIGLDDFIGIVRAAARRVGDERIRVGAGAGTWSPVATFEALARLPELDDINLHIYPISRGYGFDRIVEIAELARRHGKSVSIGEAWLYKVSSREVGSIEPGPAFGRDIWSFWEPLDVTFVESVISLARRIDARFCSFFWMQHLYGYVPYDARVANLDAVEQRRVMQQTIAPAIVRGELSATGRAFQHAARAPAR